MAWALGGRERSRAAVVGSEEVCVAGGDHERLSMRRSRIRQADPPEAVMAAVGWDQAGGAAGDGMDLAATAHLCGSDIEALSRGSDWRRWRWSAADLARGQSGVG